MEKDPLLKWKLGVASVDVYRLTGYPARIVAGQKGNDVVKGQLGWDLLFGGPGDDVLDGGGGSDTLRGQSGTDDCAPSSDDRLVGCE